MNKVILIIVSIIIGIGAGIGGMFIFNSYQPSQEIVIVKEVKKPLFYRNPMNSEITSPMPAKDHMGMDYIPVYNDDSNKKSEPTGAVSIDPVTVQNMGVRTAIAQISELSHDIKTIGHVTYDEQRISRLHPKTEGWIEKMFISKTGESVKKGTMLLSLYSPQLVSSQQEYLLALSSLETLKDSPFDDIRVGAEQMVKTARERLELLDVPEHQIHDLEHTGKIKKGLHIHSPFNGIVINIGAREGQYVTPQTELYMLVDLSKVWVFADVYESELPWVNVGDHVEMTLTGIPNKVFKGKLSYIYPYAEAKTRTIKVRLEFDNPDLLLKPDMFANVIINTQQQNNIITVPSEAIVRSGEREQVFIVREHGKFEPRTVEIGLASNGLTQIVKGISFGEEVVTSSQFLIDSESKLRESTAKMLESMNQDTAIEREYSPPQ
ncbi:MAG: efflux RND transporter periplasmic adaptor subunit, partial [Proteobacteria bacterium]|nr:efflux RND transporter periplasmic adaptor subunit [Pseudomonadota bacterium]